MRKPTFFESSLPHEGSGRTWYISFLLRWSLAGSVSFLFLVLSHLQSRKARWPFIYEWKWVCTIRGADAENHEVTDAEDVRKLFIYGWQRNLVSVFLFAFVFVFVFVDGGDEQKLFTHGALILTPDIHERPTERDRGGALQTSVLCNQIKRKQSNRLCKCQDNSNWKLWNQENKAARNICAYKSEFFLQLVGQKKRISVFFTAGLTKVFSRWLDKRRKGNCYWRKKPCYSGLLTPNFHSWNIPKRSHLPNIHEYPKWCCFGNLVRAMPDMHCLVANGDLASLHVLISKFFSS